MSENIKVFKSIAGEDILAEVVDTKDTHYVLKNPASLVLQETEQGVRVGLQPFMPFAKGNIALYANSVMCEAIPDDSMVKEYKRIFSPIETPTNSIIIPK